MARYALNLPSDLKREAEELAAQQGISLNQFIMWSVSEKVSTLRQSLDDPDFPGITYRKGASGWVSPVVKGTGIRVQTIAKQLIYGMKPEQIAEEYNLDLHKVNEAQAFYNAHRMEIEGSMIAEEKLEVRGD